MVKNKKLFTILTLVCFMFTLMPMAAMASNAVGTEDALRAAIANGERNITLSENITLTEAITTSSCLTTIDLNSKTLTIGAGDNKFIDASNVTIKNGTINITGVAVKGNAIFCLDEYEKTDVTTLILENVNLIGDGYSSAYGIFYIGASSVLNVIGGEWNLQNDAHASGGVFKADDSRATLTITGTKMTLHDVRRVVTHAATAIDGANIAISGDADGVDVEMEHGFNRSSLAIKNSTITMKDMVGRGITAENGAVNIENSTVKMTNVQEATIDVRNNQIVTVDADSNVTLDKAPTVTSGSISGDVAIDLGDAAVAKIGLVEYASLQEALNVAVAGSGNVTVEILDNIDLENVAWTPVTVSAPGYPMVIVNGNNHTITGLTDMLFAGTWAGGSELIINDLTIANSNIVNDKDDAKGTVGVGAFIGYPQASATITLNNCHLVNSTVTGGHWTGGLIGMAGGYNGNDGPVFMNLTIKDCSVTGSAITGKGSVGGVIGHGSCAAWTQVVITNTEVKGNTITSTGDSKVKAGTVMGTIGAAGQPTTAAGEEKTGGMEVSVTESGNTVTSNGATITTVYGRQGSSTGTLVITGGSYANYPIENNVEYAKIKAGYCVSKVSPYVVVAEHTADAAVQENRVEATYSAPGSYDSVVYCSACGKELSRETKTIAQLVYIPVYVPDYSGTPSAPSTSDKTETTTTVTPSGNTVKVETETKADGTKVETTTTTTASGETTKVEVTTETDKEGTTVETTKTTDAKGETTTSVTATLDNGSAVTNNDDAVKVEVSKVEEKVVAQVEEALKADEAVTVVGTVDNAVSVSAANASTGAAQANFTQPMSVSVPVDTAVLNNVTDTSKLTMAKVVTNEDGTTELVYMGGSYDKATGTFNAKVDEDGDYILVEKEDLVKIELNIGEIDIKHNEAATKMEVAPEINEDNRTMLQLSYIADALGCQTFWDEATRTVTVVKGDITMKMVIDELIPGFDTKAVVKNGRTLVPAGYISGMLGANVIWDPAAQQVIIVK